MFSIPRTSNSCRVSLSRQDFFSRTVARSNYYRTDSLSVSSHDYRKDGEPPFRAVLLDLEGMELSSALQLVRELRKEFSNDRLAILILTASSATTVHRQVHEAGCAQIVLKPIRSTTLCSVLLTAIGIGAKAAPKPVTNNAKMLEGKTLLVVSDFKILPICVVRFLNTDSKVL